MVLVTIFRHIAKCNAFAKKRDLRVTAPSPKVPKFVPIPSGKWHCDSLRHSPAVGASKRRAIPHMQSPGQPEPAPPSACKQRASSVQAIFVPKFWPAACYSNRRANLSLSPLPSP